MALNPQVVGMLQQMESVGMPNPVALGVDGYRQMIAAMGPLEEGEAVAQVSDRQVPHGALKIPVRVYRPETAEQRPGVLVFFHGGGFVACGLETHDGLCRSLCNAGRCVVVSVDYRLAPEAQFPLPLEDCYAATRWVAANADALQVDAGRLAVGGDSAGGTFAAAVSLMARDRDGGPAIRHQFLLDPALDSACNSPSYTEFAEGYFLTREMMQWFWAHYLGSADRSNPLASPTYAKRLEGLPPATVVSAECDPLRDETEAYADRLETAGVAVTRKRYDGMIHGFLSLPALSVAAAARKEIGGWIAKALGKR